jgi:norsolorinic acid ketoreductase
MDAEEEQLTAFVISPGWVQTELGNTGARAFGLEKAALTVEESCSGVVMLIEKATKEGHGGKLWGHDGELLVW